MQLDAGASRRFTVLTLRTVEERTQTGPVPGPREWQPRIQIEDPRPLIDGGRYRAKAVVGDTYEVAALIFRDGPDILRAVVKHRPAGAGHGESVPWREETL